MLFSTRSKSTAIVKQAQLSLCLNSALDLNSKEIIAEVAYCSPVPEPSKSKPVCCFSFLCFYVLGRKPSVLEAKQVL